MIDSPSTELDALPSICGPDEPIAKAMAPATRTSTDSTVLTRAKSSFAIALHMHQPLIPAGGHARLNEAPVISNLQFMLEHPEVVTDRLADLLTRAGAVPSGATVGGYGSTAQPG